MGHGAGWRAEWAKNNQPAKIDTRDIASAFPLLERLRHGSYRPEEVLMQLLRRFTRFEIQDAAIWKIAELMAYAMFVNLFLLGAEVFKEYYSNTEHLIHMKYMFVGVEGHTSIVPYMWASVIFSIPRGAARLSSE